MKRLSSMSIMLMTVSSVDSIRNVPTIALTGNQVLWQFGVIVLTFLLPITR